MKTKLYRFASVLLAIFIGVLLVVAFTLIGNESKGPLQDFLDGTSSLIVSIEDHYIAKSRTKQRVKSLEDFAPYRNDIALCINPDRILLGAFDNNTENSFESIISLEDSLNTKFELIHLYTAWGSEPEQRFPETKARAITSLGSIPLITWEPWLTDFSKKEYPLLQKREERDWGGLKDIAAGLYDPYIQQWVKDIAKFEDIVYIRFGHEMNDPYRYPWGPHNNKPEDFVAAWKHVVDLFDSSGVDNIVWVWAPHPAYGYFRFFYPGDEYVDWVAVGALNYGNVASWSKWWSFAEIFGNHYDSLAVFDKPIMISEFGSLSTDGDQLAWYKNALTDLPLKYPAIKALLFFHFSDDNTTTYKSLNWYIKDNQELTEVIGKAIEGWENE